MHFELYTGIVFDSKDIQNTIIENNFHSVEKLAISHVCIFHTKQGQGRIPLPSFLRIKRRKYNFILFRKCTYNDHLFSLNLYFLNPSYKTSHTCTYLQTDICKYKKWKKNVTNNTVGDNGKRIIQRDRINSE